MVEDDNIVSPSRRWQYCCNCILWNGLEMLVRGRPGFLSWENFAPPVSNSLNTSLLNCLFALFCSCTFVCSCHLRNKWGAQGSAEDWNAAKALNMVLKEKEESAAESEIAHEVEGQEEWEPSLLEIKGLFIEWYPNFYGQSNPGEWSAEEASIRCKSLVGI